MNIKELYTEYKQIFADYSKTREDCTEQLRSLFINFNNNNTKYNHAGIEIDLCSASIESMRDIIEDIQQENKTAIRGEQNEAFREEQACRNIYTRDNPYGQGELTNE